LHPVSPSQTHCSIHEATFIAYFFISTLRNKKSFYRKEDLVTNSHEFDQPSTYQIRLKGVLDASWSDWFDGFTITVEGNDTILLGCVPDQSALHGILAKINDLGLLLVSVNKQAESI
jgi:hypothetical protein